MAVMRVLEYLFFISSMWFLIFTLPDSILNHLGWSKNFHRTVQSWISWIYIAALMVPQAIAKARLEYLRSPYVMMVVKEISYPLRFLVKVHIIIAVLINILPSYITDHLGWTPNLRGQIREWTRWLLVAATVPFLMANVKKYHLESVACRQVVANVLSTVVLVMFILPNSMIDSFGWPMAFYYDVRRLSYEIALVSLALLAMAKAREAIELRAALAHQLEQVLLQGQMNAAQGG